MPRFVSLATAALAIGSTLAAPSSVVSVTYDAGFGSDGPAQGTPINGSVPGLYDALNYTNLQYHGYTDNYASYNCKNICPHTNYTNADSTALPAAISANYANSTIRSFQLSSLYFGCWTMGNYSSPYGVAQLSTPANCTLTVRGYKNPKAAVPTGKADVKVSVAYQPVLIHGSLGVNYSAPVFYQLPDSFAGMKTVTFDTAFKGPPAAGFNYTQDKPTLAVDDLVYTVRQVVS